MTADRDILSPLVERVLTVAADPAQDVKKKLWADHQEMRRTAKAPVCVYYELIPDPHWEPMIGRLQAVTPLARSIEKDLRKRLWMAENVPDDHIVWPSLAVNAVVKRPVSWGVTFGLEGTGRAADEILEGRRMAPAFPDRIQAERIHFTDWQIDTSATERLREEAARLVRERLPVHVSYPDLGCSPFDVAVEMRGMESLMCDVVDDPDGIHALMEAITSGFEQHHKRREAQGWLNCRREEDRYLHVGFRVHCAYPSADLDARRPRLRDEWSYVSAQTSSGLGPDTYAELVHPGNVRMAALFSRVYYHGCECLDHKIGTIAGLPNLRRFHVSPWSSVEVAKRTLGGRAVLEIHSHPGRVLFGWSAQEMKDELVRLARGAEGAVFDLNLSDIHSLGGKPATLGVWASVAQEVARKYA